MCVLLVSHNGEGAEAAVNKIRAELPKPIIDWCRPDALHRPCRRMFDPFYPKGMQWYWKGDFVRDLPDAAIAAHIEHATKGNDFSCMHLYPIDGAVQRRQSDETAWNMRDATWSMVIAGSRSRAGRARPRSRDWANGLLGGRAPLQPCRAPTRTS